MTKQALKNSSLAKFFQEALDSSAKQQVESSLGRASAQLTKPSHAFTKQNQRYQKSREDKKNQNKKSKKSSNIQSQSNTQVVLK